jgi:acetyl esterase/lipase
VTVAETLDDAAEAVAWVFRHVGEYGGDARKIVVTGHSAGGYLSMMLCLNKAWLARYGVDADEVMLYVPFSGQAITHYNVRKMQGIGPLKPTIDEWAPLYWVRNDCPPLVLICGDRELELYGRYDENQYLDRMMKLVGHKQTYLYELDGHDHGSMVDPAFHILERHIRQMKK